jgi:3' terminal RNA ribose 2'-O-methyltransferase Hen1
MLGHLYVLIPALDEQTHYFVDRLELDKLLRRGQGWLETHPAKEEIVRRYLHRDRSLVVRALTALQGEDAVAEELDKPEDDAPEKAPPLHSQRLQTVVDEIRASGARSVLDLGCGEGKLLRLLLKEKSIARILGMDVSYAALERTKERLIDRLPRLQAQRIELIHGSLVYRDKRLAGFDAAAIVEVIEHLDEGRLAAFERVIFEFARPALVVLTTPNREYNELYPGLEGMRHQDHRFEWTRAEFQSWCDRVGEAHGYNAEIRPIGPLDEQYGAPSQMAVFRRSG